MSLEGDAGGRGRGRKGELALWPPGRCGHLLRRSLGRAGVSLSTCPEHKCISAPAAVPGGGSRPERMEEIVGYSGVAGIGVILPAPSSWSRRSQVVAARQALTP